jgi:cytochrome c heme-lyase
MPLEPNQVPCAGQRRPLPTARTPSTIPKAGVAAGGTWVYPSPQMFFNALARKGKGGDVREEDMEAVVHAHNCGFFCFWLVVVGRTRSASPNCRPATITTRSDALSFSTLLSLAHSSFPPHNHTHTKP